VQAAGYGLVLGAVGILLGKKTGLWKDERKLEKKPLILTAIVAILGGMLLILSDLLFFGNYSDAIRESYAVKPTVTYILAAVVYGGVIEEVMLRLFFMSLLAFLLQKLFRKGSGTTGLLIAANLIAALLFAAAHLPATAMLMGLTPMILFRCFLLNGGLGLLFGWLYRKFGLRYAMLAHAGCHVVSKLIWILFV
jgi:intracellular septation protein A